MINYYDEVWNTLGSYAFIAIDFSNKFAHVYEEIIYPAVVDAGMLPIRSDEIISESENVSSQIRQLIQNSRIIPNGKTQHSERIDFAASKKYKFFRIDSPKNADLSQRKELYCLRICHKRTYQQSISGSGSGI